MRYIVTFLSFLTIVAIGIIVWTRPNKSIIANIPMMYTETGSLPICIRDPQVSTFMFHYIRDYDPRDTAITKWLSIPPAIFDEDMKTIDTLRKKWLITLMNGEEFLNSWTTGCYPGKNIWIMTSDDGWSDSYIALMPIAKKYQIPFFFGIITKKVWAQGFMTETDIRTLSENPLFTISSHSLEHEDQSHTSTGRENTIMCESRRYLESVTGKSVITYVYPSGKLDPMKSPQNARACGYMLAWSTAYGNDWNTTKNPYTINRIRVTAGLDDAYFIDLARRQHTEQISPEVTHTGAVHP
jgi:peptidoglycan/xylan/chitin deacetylase (PgdA/CDA1 family)